MKPRITRALDAATSVEDVDRDKRTVVHKINTDAIDRYHTMIAPTGGRFDAYRSNPVVLANHNTERTPIGKNLDLKPYARKIIARTKFIPPGIDEEADKIFELYALGYLNAWSVSILPVSEGPPTPDEIRKRPELAECRCVYREWELLEYSCVTVPGNAEATRSAIARGLALPGWAEPPAAAPTPAPAPAIAAAAELPALTGRTLDQFRRDRLALVRAIARGELADVARDAVDLARGKV